MGTIISTLVTAVREVYLDIVRGIININETYRQINSPPIGRRLLLRHADENCNIRSRTGTLQILCIEEGPECRLYISGQNDEGVSMVDATVYQNTTQSPYSEVNASWTQPGTGNPDGMTAIYPINARALMDLFR